MSKKYCQLCNGVSEFADVTPKFCQSCGQPFAGTVANTIKIDTEVSREIRPQRKIIARRPTPEDDEYYEEDEVTHHQIVEFAPPEIELTIPKRQTEKIGSLAASRGPKENLERPKLKIKGDKQIEKMFKNDVTKGGKNNSIEIGGAGGE